MAASNARLEAEQHVAARVVDTEEMVCEEEEIDDVSAAAYFEMLEAFGYELHVNCGWPEESANAFVAQFSVPSAPQAQGGAGLSSRLVGGPRGAQRPEVLALVRISGKIKGNKALIEKKHFWKFPRK